jgi:predicted SnoaL-like aldol condensation-catalyzing enzyme
LDNSELERNKQLVRTATEEVLNRRELGAVDRLFHAAYFQHNPQAPPGPEGVKSFFSALFVAIPDLRATIDHLYAEGDRVFSFITWRGTHRGPIFGFEPSGQPVVIHTAEIFRIEGGRLAEHWDTVDLADLVMKSAAKR